MMSVQSHVHSAISVPCGAELLGPFGVAPCGAKAAVRNATGSPPRAEEGLASAGGRRTATAVIGPAVLPSRTQRDSASQCHSTFL